MPSLSRSRGFLTIGLIAVVAPASAQWRFVDIHPAGATSSTAYSIAGPVYAAGAVDGFYGRAYLWKEKTVRDVTPRNSTGAILWDTRGTQSVGSAMINGLLTAGIWSGLAFASLAPTGATDSDAYGIHNNRQVGYFIDPSTNYTGAALWLGTPQSVVRLHPQGWDDVSVAYAVYNNIQVGGASMLSLPGLHACRWAGTAASFFDMHPSGFDSSVAFDVHGPIAVGMTYVRDPNTGMHSNRKAWRWSMGGGTGRSMHPTAFAQSQANGVTTGAAVGRVVDAAGNARACFWDLTAGRMTDLHRILPRGVYSRSAAFKVWTDGRGRFEVAGSAIDTASGQSHAIVWVKSPSFP